MFGLSHMVFEALVVELSPLIISGRFYNGDQNVTAQAKIAIALYEGYGFTLGVAAKLKKILCSSTLRQIACHDV